MKWVLSGIGLLVAIILAALVYVYLNLGSLIKYGVETYTPPILGVDVTVDSVSVIPLSGRGGINGFVIGNPEGYEQIPAIGMGKVAIDIDTGSLASDTIIINSMVLDAPEINFIQLDKSRNNFADIIKNIETSDSSETSDGEPAPTDSAETKLIIDKIEITNVKITASSPLLPNEKLSIPIPNIYLQDLGRDTNGATPEQLAKTIAEQLLAQIKTAVLNSDVYKEKIKAKVQEKLDAEKIRAKKRLEKEKDKLEQKLSDKLGVKAKDLKSLFGK